LSEFEIIQQYFKHATENPNSGVIVGIGDDAAVVTVPEGMQLVLSMDTLIAGVHFYSDMDAEDIGYKSLAVNLSDMAAMGAKPVWATMSLTLPDIDHVWLEKFMDGFKVLANEYTLTLIGGDLSRGPLSITIQLHGLVPGNTAIKRNGSTPGDLIFISGTLGDAGLALKAKQETISLPDQDMYYVFNRLNRPSPRVNTGIALRGIASSMIDVSDGLISDLGHIVKSSCMGAVLNLEKLPLSNAVSRLSPEEAWELALTAGDDYELCFTVRPEKKAEVEDKINAISPITCIGEITEQEGIKCVGIGAVLFKSAGYGYDHF
jgi:thiamine-monophosphate kinase